MLSNAGLINNHLNASNINNSKITVKVSLINTRSIKNKVIALTESLDSKHIDLCCVTETWVNESDKVTFSELADKGFILLNQPRAVSRGGGVGFLFRRNFIVHQVNTPVFKTFEILQTSLIMKRKTFTFCIIYRTGQMSCQDHLNFLAEIDVLLLKLQDKKESLIICGDFNLHVNDANSKQAQEFLDIMESFGFYQLVTVPTHIASGTIDLIFVKDVDLVSNIIVYNETNDVLLSDHFLLGFELRLGSNPSRKLKEYQYRNTKQLDIDKFSQDLKVTMNNSLMHEKNLDANCRTQLFMDNLKRVIDHHAPVVKKTKLILSKPFTNDEIRKVKRIKRKAERKFRKSGSLDDRDTFKKAVKDVVETVRISENKFYSDKLSSVKNDPKSVYNIINHLLNKGKQRNLPDSSNQLDLADNFAIFFHEKIRKIRNLIRSSTKESTSTSSISTEITSGRNSNSTLTSFEKVNKESLQTILVATKNKYASIDDIPTDTLKLIKSISIDNILELINCSLESGVFPNSLKISHVTPVLKDRRGNMNSLSNYRPVISPPFLSKIIEKDVFMQLKSHLEENNLFSKYQSAYKANHSCETALLKIYEDLLCMMKPNTGIVMVFLDFSAAFDTIDHSILLQKLNSQFLIKGTALAWFESFLKDRSFAVNIDNNISRSFLVEQGVPQGSVLGPVLFSLYTQEVYKIVNSYNFNIHMFADDIQIYFQCDNSKYQLEQLKKCLEEIKEWARSNFLKLNPDKTKFLTISGKRSNPLIFSNFLNHFSFETKVKNLGFFLDSSLDFSAQINKVCQTGFALLRNLWRISSKLSDTSLKIQIVQSCILTHIDYCNSLYVSLPGCQIKKLQRLMNASIRFIYNIRLSDDYSITEYMQKCHFLPVKARIDYKICLLVYKIMSGAAPSYLKELVRPKDSLQSLRVYRDQFLLDEPKLDQNEQKNRRFSIAAPKIWNGLPLEVRQSDSLHIFKIRLKSYLFSKHFKVP